MTLFKRKVNLTGMLLKRNECVHNAVWKYSDRHADANNAGTHEKIVSDINKIDARVHRLKATGSLASGFLKDNFAAGTKAGLTQAMDLLTYKDNLSFVAVALAAALIGSATFEKVANEPVVAHDQTIHSAAHQNDTIKAKPQSSSTVKASPPSASFIMKNLAQHQGIIQHHQSQSVDAAEFANTPILYSAPVAVLKTMAGPYVSDVKRAAEKNHMSPRLIASVVYVETTGKKGIQVSHAGAIGPMQLMPKTAWNKLRVNPWNPAQNINGGTEYLSELVGRYHSIKLALIAYNEGPTSVDLGHIDEQSVEYADKILALAEGKTVEQVQHMPS